MAIKVVCSECEREMKVKDELLGRKVKCPDCGTSIVVGPPAGSKPAAKAKAPVPPPEPEVEDDEQAEDEEDRPRDKKKKKKKKQQKSGKGLLIGLIAGGVLLVGGGVAAFIFLGGGGNSKPTGGTPANVEAPANKAEPPGTKSLVGTYVRPLGDVEAANYLKQIATAYHDFYGQHRRGPKDRQELEAGYSKNPTVNAVIDEKTGWVEFLYGADLLQMADGSSNTILAFEKEAFNGQRIVLFADGAVRGVDEDEFQKAPKAIPKK